MAYDRKVLRAKRKDLAVALWVKACKASLELRLNRNTVKATRLVSELLRMKQLVATKRDTIESAAGTGGVQLTSVSVLGSNGAVFEITNAFIHPGSPSTAFVRVRYVTDRAKGVVIFRPGDGVSEVVIIPDEGQTIYCDTVDDAIKAVRHHMAGTRPVRA